MAEAISNMQFVSNTQNSISYSDMGDAIRMDDQENGEANDVGMPESNEMDHEESAGTMRMVLSFENNLHY